MNKKTAQKLLSALLCCLIFAAPPQAWAEESASGDDGSGGSSPSSGCEFGEWKRLDDFYHQRESAGDPSVVETEEHKWDGGEEISTPNCGYGGETLFTCTVCGAEKTVTGEKDENHHIGKLAVINVKEATCTEPGYSGDTICTLCGTVRFKGVETKPAGHVFGIRITPPTCEEDGVKTLTCVKCKYRISEPVPAMGHTDEDGDGLCDNCMKELSSRSDAGKNELCPTCGEEHKGFFGGIVRLIHKFIYFLKNLFK